jgi:hypothetical protein
MSIFHLLRKEPFIWYFQTKRNFYCWLLIWTYTLRSPLFIIVYESQYINQKQCFLNLLKTGKEPFHNTFSHFNTYQYVNVFVLFYTHHSSIKGRRTFTTWPNLNPTPRPSILRAQIHQTQAAIVRPVLCCHFFNEKIIQSVFEWLVGTSQITF